MYYYGLHTNWAEATALYNTFTRVWGAGGEASLSLDTRGGQVRAQLSLGLGPPTHRRPGAPGRGAGAGTGPQDQQHHHDHHHPPGPPGGARRRRAPADRRRDAARRARYVAARAARDQEVAPSDPATPATTSSSTSSTSATPTPSTVANQVTLALDTRTLHKAPGQLGRQRMPCMLRRSSGWPWK